MKENRRLKFDDLRVPPSRARGGTAIAGNPRLAYEKELKNGIGMESLPSVEFGGNAMWFCLGVLAYNVFVLKRELILPQEYKNKTISTIRWFFIEIAGEMVKHGRRLWLHVSTTVEKFNLLLHIRKKIMAFV